MEERIIMAGFGGQGVMFMGKLLAYAAMLKGKSVTWIPSYGPEMRGGTANCSVVLSDNEIACPVVNKPTILVAMNGPSLEKFMPVVVPGGTVIVNSSIVKEVPNREDVEVIKVPANDIANELQSASIANMVALGVVLTRTGIIEKEDVLAALEKNVSDKKAHLLPVNIKAIEKGMEFIRT